MESIVYEWSMGFDPHINLVNLVVTRLVKNYRDGDVANSHIYSPQLWRIEEYCWISLVKIMTTLPTGIEFCYNRIVTN